MRDGAWQLLAPAEQRVGQQARSAQCSARRSSTGAAGAEAKQRHIWTRTVSIAHVRAINTPQSTGTQYVYMDNRDYLQAK